MAAPGTILVVDNNPGDQELVRLALEDAGISAPVEALIDGELAMRTLAAAGDQARSRYAVVLLDLNMPRVHGRDVLAWVRSQPVLTGLPVIVLTSSQSPRDREECERLGADGYWVKPAHFEDFVRMVDGIRRYLPAA